ncbi:hypothetical protein [Sphingomonas sp. NFR15]|uniref:hypothetical protein n=1 Tax=Sphingomonas sp. NFR15 TaxID=1566282 RepID=UPI0015A41CF5|nr:hypothetical protein [Sphingomonas sp. NFR15]
MQLTLLAFFAVKQWLDRRDMYAQAKEESRTHETALLASDDQFVRQSALRSLAALPPLSGLNGDGLRFVALPSFGMNNYALAVFLPRNAQQAVGVLIVTSIGVKGAATHRREFRMPASAYRTLVADVDRRTDGWPGDADMCLDGIPAGFERVRGSRVTSGIGNCSPHYKALKAVILRAMRRFAPVEDLPAGDDWMRMEPTHKAAGG